MISKIVKGYGALFAGVSRVLLLLITCTAIGSAFVIPLWAFAMNAPSVYTAVVLIIACAIITFIAIKRAKVAGFKRTMRFCLQFAVIALGIIGLILFVLNGNRFFAVTSFLLAIVVYGIVSFGLSSSSKHETRTENA